MEIKWHNNTCFTFRDKAASLVINPEKDSGKLKAEVMLSSLPTEGIEIEDLERSFDWPGEYEIKGIPVLGFQAWTKSKSEEEKGSAGDETIIFYFEIGKVRFCHLGGLGHKLTPEMVKELENVDVLMLEAGKDCNLDLKTALDVVEAIDPRVVIPMGKADSAALLKELGAGELEAQDKLVIKSRSDLPDDTRQYVLLNKV